MELPAGIGVRPENTQYHLPAQAHIGKHVDPASQRGYIRDCVYWALNFQDPNKQPCVLAAPSYWRSV